MHGDDDDDDSDDDDDEEEEVNNNDDDHDIKKLFNIKRVYEKKTRSTGMQI